MNLAYEPDLSRVDWIQVNSSAGKDSQTTLRQTVLYAESRGFPRERIKQVHADLGEMEWPGVKELAQTQADMHGVEMFVEHYKDQHGRPLTLLEYIEQRGKWPSNTCRFCTSEFKRGPCLRRLVWLHEQTPRQVRISPKGFYPRRSTIINVYGFRAEESPSRRKKLPWSLNKRASTRSRDVYDWLPIHTWSESDVWADIRASGVPHHSAYDIGMPRLSCRFCIFAPRAALLIAGRANPDLLQKYVELEKKIGHDFQHKKPLAMVQDALMRGEMVCHEELTGAWNM